jgi:hypothetical protein
MVEEVRDMEIMELLVIPVLMNLVQVLVMEEQVGCMEGEAILAVVVTILMQGRKSTFMQLFHKLCLEVSNRVL